MDQTIPQLAVSNTVPLCIASQCEFGRPTGIRSIVAHPHTMKFRMCAPMAYIWDRLLRPFLQSLSEKCKLVNLMLYPRLTHSP